MKGILIALALLPAARASCGIGYNVNIDFSGANVNLVMLDAFEHGHRAHGLGSSSRRGRPSD